MEADRTDRTELLEQIVTEGDRRKRRRRLIAAGGGALAAVALVAGVGVAGGGAREEVTAADGGTTTTQQDTSTSTTEPPTTTTDTTAALETSTTIVEDELPAPTTTEPPLVCRNSTDDRCGEPFWDLPPGFVNAPLEISLGAEPLQATVGVPVTFTVAAIDPDARAGICGVDLGGGELLSQYQTYCTVMLCLGLPPGHGPWDPPAPTAHEPTFLERRAVWNEPGTYTITVGATSNQDCSVPSIFHSDANATFTIDVRPA